MNHSLLRTLTGIAIIAITIFAALPKAGKLWFVIIWGILAIGGLIVAIVGIDSIEGRHDH